MPSATSDNASRACQAELEVWSRWHSRELLSNLTLLVSGAASAISIAAAVISLALLLSPKSWSGFAALNRDRVCTRFGLAISAPLAALLISEKSGTKHTRFAAALPCVAPPLFLVLRQALPRTLAWSDLSFALGAPRSLGILLIAPEESSIERFTSRILNPIHNGDIALLRLARCPSFR